MAEDADYGVRHLVLVHGRDTARRMVEPERRPLVDIAADVMADDAGRIGITYTGFCLTGLPHKRLPDDQRWEKKGHRVTLIVEPGLMRTGRHGQTKLHGVPYQPVEKAAAQLKWSGSMLRATAASWSSAVRIRRTHRPPAGVTAAAR